jgi:hypothetical protein
MKMRNSAVYQLDGQVIQSRVLNARLDLDTRADRINIGRNALFILLLTSIVDSLFFR